MGRKIRKSFLLIGLLLPIFSLAQRTPTPAPCATCKQIPDGGSSAEYLVGVGAICGAGLLLRRRLRKT